MAFSEPLSWMNGRRLREDVAAVAAGVYLVRLHYPGGVHTRRMLYLE